MKWLDDYRATPHSRKSVWYQGNRWYHGVIAFLLVGVLFVGVNLIFTGKAFG